MNETRRYRVSRDHPFDRHSLIRLAEHQYDPALVKVDHQLICSIPWPANAAEPMSLDLPESMAGDPVAAICFLLSMTSINYRFWTLEPDGIVSRYSHMGKTGARALWASFEAVWGPNLHYGAELAARLQADDFTALFGHMPDQEGRLAILGELLAPDKLQAVAQLLLADIRSNGKTTVEQAFGLAAFFPLAFDDPYLKKAQLALSMIAAVLRDTGIEVNVADLTAFADYQVPRVLRALGVLDYSPSLADRVDHHQFLEEGGREEQAIRAATIIACEAIAAHTGGTSADIDNLLWLSQDIAGETPFHLTETRWY